MEKSNVGVFRYLTVACIIGGVSYYLFYSSTTLPVEALSRAMRLSHHKENAEIEPLLSISMKDELIRHWAILLQAQLTERKNISKARELYASVPRDSAASLDARLSLLRLPRQTQSEKQSQSQSENIGQEISTLEAEIKLARRHDLLGELQLIRAQQAIHAGELLFARTLLQQTRHQFISSAVATQAKQLQYNLENLNSESLQVSSVAALVAEARLLLEEGDATSALDKIQLAKSQTTEQSPAAFEVMLVEEQVLRHLSRREEADHLLLLLSADGGPTIADAALLKIASNAWNLNDHHKALSFLDKLQERFPQSPLVSESLYREARILEELELLTEAKEIFLELSKREDEPEKRIYALQRIAYMYLRSGNYLRAAEYFHNSQGLALSYLKQHPNGTSLPISQTVSDRESTQASNLRTPDARTPEASAQDPTNQEAMFREVLAHSLFWEAYALEKLDHALWEKLPYEASPPLALRAELLKVPSSGYYPLLIEHEKMSTPHLVKVPAGAALERAGSKAEEQSDHCVPPPPPILAQRVKELSHAGLKQLAQYELDWHFLVITKPPSLNGPSLNGQLPEAAQDAPENFIRPWLGYIRLSLDHGSVRLAVAEAERVQRQISRLGREHFQTCLSTLQTLSYPMPYSDIFESAANAREIPPPLLYAIARTESYFDENAKSSAGALGLAQLLPQTAKQEGLREGESLFDPKVNLSLGAKHLARLLAGYKGDRVLAVAAYNAGTSAVNRWRARYGDIDQLLWIELIAYPETRNYVKRVLLAEQVYRKRPLASMTTGAG